MTRENTGQFIEGLCKISTTLKRKHFELLAYWSPDYPPDIVVLGDLGNAIVDNYDSLTAEEKFSIFELIERGMSSSSTELATCVATGLIEALIGRASRLGNWEKIAPMLAEESTRYAEAWMSPL